MRLCRPTSSMPSSSAAGGASAPGAVVTDAATVRIALHTLGMFNFRGIQLLPFLRDCVVRICCVCRHRGYAFLGSPAYACAQRHRLPLSCHSGWPACLALLGRGAHVVHATLAAAPALCARHVFCRRGVAHARRIRRVRALAYCTTLK